mmetsp:Transcript_50333/g.135501  ORF Transcript_50333/g.135501 Transcript_50333/m.135501 type:complete len:208 (-) Transcript_50333:211-834(-)
MISLLSSSASSPRRRRIWMTASSVPRSADANGCSSCTFSWPGLPKTPVLPGMAVQLATESKSTTRMTEPLVCRRYMSVSRHEVLLPGGPAKKSGLRVSFSMPYFMARIIRHISIKCLVPQQPAFPARILSPLPVTSVKSAPRQELRNSAASTAPHGKKLEVLPKQPALFLTITPSFSKRIFFLMIGSSMPAPSLSDNAASAIRRNLR